MAKLTPEDTESFRQRPVRFLVLLASPFLDEMGASGSLNLSQEHLRHSHVLILWSPGN